ncbi:MAG: hypothetical protein JSS61_00085 [Verrucomicrobia bacterium]|nr:hypothetical protein [Verrucomicrobiota bacterium]
MSTLSDYKDFCVFPFKQSEHLDPNGPFPNGICAGICMGYIKHADQFSERIQNHFEEFLELQEQYGLSQRFSSPDGEFVDWDDEGTLDKLRALVQQDNLFIQHVLHFDGHEGHAMISKVEGSQISVMDPNVGEYRFSYPAQGRELLGFFRALRSHYSEQGHTVHKWVVSPINQERLNKLLMRTQKKSIAELMESLSPFLNGK